jgi:hypothetical protein
VLGARPPWPRSCPGCSTAWPRAARRRPPRAARGVCLPQRGGRSPFASGREQLTEGGWPCRSRPLHRASLSTVLRAFRNRQKRSVLRKARYATPKQHGRERAGCPPSVSLFSDHPRIPTGTPRARRPRTKKAPTPASAPCSRQRGGYLRLGPLWLSSAAGLT